MAKHYPEQVRSYFEFQFFTGLRPEEAIALRWGDVDWSHRTVRVERAKTFKGTVKAIKTHSARDVELNSRALAALKRMQPLTKMKREDVFENPVTDEPWHDDRSQRDHYWKPSLTRAKVRYRTAYNTRHTYATMCLMSDCNPAWVSRQLGHKNAKMLFTVYAKWIDKADNSRQIKKLEDALSPPIRPAEKLSD
jgi:integrase